MALPTPTIVSEIPARKRVSIADELAAWVKAQPLDGPTVDGNEATPVFQYAQVSQNLARTLAEEHGLDSANREVGKSPNKVGQATLYVRYVPALTAHFKAEAAKRTKKGKNKK